ncbi:MAG TPA: hypothetical protein VM791_11105 [Vicinamibacterales bacterium]|nr:hypothetical protein [Vicinamibacterales bacterium]
MRTPPAPRLALTVLERFVPDNEALTGDLLEEFDARPSTVWFWVQVLAAIAAAWRTRGAEIRPLRLVDFQPADAAERTRHYGLRFPPVNLSPVAGMGGLGFMLLIGLMTRTMPAAWWLLLASALAGCVLGAVLIVLARPGGARMTEPGRIVPSGAPRMKGSV